MIGIRHATTIRLTTDAAQERWQRLWALDGWVSGRIRWTIDVFQCRQPGAWL